MSRSQRLIYLAVAAAIAIVAIVVLSTGSADDEGEQAATPVPTQTPAAQEAGPAGTVTAEPTPEPAPKPPLLRPGAEHEIEVVEGDTVRFRVRVDEPDELHVHGYDIERELVPGKTATVSFVADITGIFEIELHHAQPALLAQLKVEPR